MKKKIPCLPVKSGKRKTIKFEAQGWKKEYSLQIILFQNIQLFTVTHI